MSDDQLKTCQHCRWWMRPRSDDDLVGKLCVWLTSDVPRGVKISGRRGRVTTEPDWGCIDWRPRDTQQAES